MVLHCLFSSRRRHTRGARDWSSDVCSSDLDDVTEIFKPIKRHYMAKSALEGAIWDLHAKREGKTLAAALGGERKTIDVGVSIGIKSSIDELLEEIKENVDAGYKRIKIKIKPDWDVDVIREVRNHFPNIDRTR